MEWGRKDRRRRRRRFFERREGGKGEGEGGSLFGEKERAGFTPTKVPISMD